MQPTRKGTRVYTRVQLSTEREITVRKRNGSFTLYLDSQEMESFPTQQAAMEAADRMAGGIVLQSAEQ